eukprot:gene1178-1746_t
MSMNMSTFSPLSSRNAAGQKLTASKASSLKPTGRGTAGQQIVCKDYPKPKQISQTDNYKEATALTEKIRALKGKGEKKTVAIIGGGLSGLSCAKYLSEAGHTATVYEARDVLGGKVSAWQDKDGDWIETGLHIFFGAYPNMMNLFAELDIEDRLQWKIHQMIFAMQELPGEFTTFDFLPGIPAPFNFGLAILLNQKMLTLAEKLQTAPPLIPMLIEGQSFIDEQDELSVLDFMQKYGMPDRINEEAAGGDVVMNARFKEFVLNSDGSIKHLAMKDGSIIEADEYVSAMPVDVVKRVVPEEWSTMPYFRQLDNLEGIPVINLHLWFDRKLKNVDHLCFSRSPLLSVFISMAKALDFIDPDKLSMTVVLTAMNRFLNETDGLQMAFLDGNPPDRICKPMADFVKDFCGDIEADTSKTQHASCSNNASKL